MPTLHRFACCLLPLLLAGCAGLPADEGEGAVTSAVEARTGHGVAFGQPPPEGACQPPGSPLSTDDAIRLALTCNAGLQATYARLGIHAADVYDAGRPSNPVLSVSALSPYGDGDTSLSLGIAQPLTELLLLPARERLAREAYRQTRMAIAGTIVTHAGDTLLAYYQLQAALEARAQQEERAAAAQASADMARRFFDAGNINQITLATQAASAAHEANALSQARAGVEAARAELAHRMGLPATASGWTVPPNLPPPLADPPSPDTLLALADSQRLDLQAARAEAARHASEAGLAQRYRALGEIEAGIEAERDDDGERSLGPTLAAELPLFNQGAGRVARARAAAEQADAELRALQTAIVHEIRSQHTQMVEAAAQVRRHDRELLPLQQAILRQTQRQVNYMLADVFQLLAARQQEIATRQSRTESLLNYWTARTRLAQAIGTRLPGDTP